MKLVVSVALLALVSATRASDYERLVSFVKDLTDNASDIYKFLSNSEVEAVEAQDLNATVLFFLYTRLNPDVPQMLYLNNDDAWVRSHFEASKSTRIYVHGWLGSVTTYGAPLVRDAYLEADDCNVIIVDWSLYAKLVTVNNEYVPTISAYIGLLIDYLESKGTSLDDLIIVGHSLGAHVAGLSARAATNIVGTVIGLDPVDLQYDYADTNDRISSEDARFVRIIHTNAGEIGSSLESGDRDDFPNGGSEQPGCEFDDNGVCSHIRAYEIFVECIAQEAEAEIHE